MTKETKLLIYLSVLVLSCILAMGYISQAQAEASTVVAVTVATTTPTVPVNVYELTHRQMVWTYALEWCESGGNIEAVNPNDRDNTPSYGSFQFKPSTFKQFAIKYNIATTSLGYMDTKVQRQIVERMLFDKSVQWKNQFPDCVKKLGYPPKPISYPQLSIDKKQQAK